MSSKWEHLKSRVARDRDGIQRAATPRFLLCFEDAVSAPNYFESLRVQRGFFKETFIVDFNASVSDPLGVVNRAIELRKECIRRGDLEESDEVWCIVDVNGHTNMNDAEQKAQAKGIHLAISNPCFEYWVLLHFEDTAPPHTRCDEMISYLKRHPELK